MPFIQVSLCSSQLLTQTRKHCAQKIIKAQSFKIAPILFIMLSILTLQSRTIFEIFHFLYHYLHYFIEVNVIAQVQSNGMQFSI